MPVIKCGIDIIEINRLAGIAAGIRQRFIQRVYTAAEQAQAADSNERLAGLFAAKEAVSKALGTGIGSVHWRDIEILHQPGGEPQVVLHGAAQLAAAARGLVNWSVSISHDRDKAVAMAVACPD